MVIVKENKHKKEVIQMKENKILLEQIFRESNEKLTTGDKAEMTNVIFDTLMGNTRYPQFDTDKITLIDDDNTEGECDAKKGIIRFGYMGHEYKINIELVK
jgi:hypothetical protein